MSRVMGENILDKAEKTYELLMTDETCKGQGAQVKKLIDKLRDENMTVSVIGQFKRGKSSLANGILQDDILPVGIVPITSAVTKVVFGERCAQVRFQNGRVEDVDFERLSEFISEQENSNNALGVEEVLLHTKSEFLRNKLIFVDTPGVGSFHKCNTETAYHYMKESDAVIFLLSVDSPINQIEIDFLNNAEEYAGKFYFAVNKIDLVDEKDLKDYVEYCSKLLCRLMKREKVSLFPVSARTGSGIEALQDAIIRDCRTSARDILEVSTAKKLKDVICSALNQLNFYWKAMNMEYRELDERFEEINKTIDEIKEQAKREDGLFSIHLNEIKLQISQKVLQLFSMEYHYDIESVPEGIGTMEREEFMDKVDLICEDLQQTLSRVLLYREENAYAVCRRINNINRLTRELVKVRNTL